MHRNEPIKTETLIPTRRNEPIKVETLVETLIPMHRNVINKMAIVMRINTTVSNNFNEDIQ